MCVTVSVDTVPKRRRGGHFLWIDLICDRPAIRCDGTRSRARPPFDALSSSSAQIFGEVMVTERGMTVRDDEFRCHEEAIRLPKRRRRKVVAIRCRGSLANGVAINVETIFIPPNQDQFQFTQFDIVISGQTFQKHANRLERHSRHSLQSHYYYYSAIRNRGQLGQQTYGVHKHTTFREDGDDD